MILNNVISSNFKLGKYINNVYCDMILNNVISSNFKLGKYINNVYCDT